ncbi:MAG: hypothetical protein VB100_05460 [Angelakisella sp.]|nr:hypothetical protein [Angelakisella sp.]
MKEFKQFYLWGMNAKFYMGIYFAALVFLVGIVTLITGGDTLRVWSLFQMLIVSMIIGFGQALILGSGTDYSKGLFFSRSIVWILLSVGLTTAASYYFQWLSELPVWGYWILALFMLGGFIAMLVGQRYAQDAETIHLGIALKEFQNKNE